jgi:hypothetical protein
MRSAKFSIPVQNESLDLLARAGYNVICQPKITLGRDGKPLLTAQQQLALGLNPDKNADASIERRVFDVYAPMSNNIRNPGPRNCDEDQ